MYFVYLIYNKTTKKFYVDVTKNVNNRLKEHRNGLNTSTKYYCKDWTLVYCEYYKKDKKDAYTREKKLKHHGNGIKGIKSRISNTLRDLV